MKNGIDKNKVDMDVTQTESLEVSANEFVNESDFVLSGFTKSDNKIRYECICECGASAYIVYITILSHKNSKDQFSFPSITTIAKESGISKRQVSRYINELSEKGYLIIDSGQQGLSNKYYFPKESFYVKFSENQIFARKKKTGYGNFDVNAYNKSVKKQDHKDVIEDHKDVIEEDEDFDY